MSDHSNIKPDARLLVESLPDSATWDDLAYEVYVRQAIELGLADVEAGRTVPHDEAKHAANRVGSTPSCLCDDRRLRG